MKIFLQIIFQQPKFYDNSMLETNCVGDTILSPKSVQPSAMNCTLTWLVFPLLWAFLHLRHLIVTKLIVTTSSNAKAITSKILLFENPSSNPRMKFRIRGEYSVTISEGSYWRLKPFLVVSKGWRTATSGSSESVE